MEIEHVPRISLAPRRPAQQQRNLAIGDGVFRQIVVDAQRVAAAVAEVFAHGAAGVGRDVLERRRVGRTRLDDDRVAHGVVLFQRLDHLRDGRALLPNGDVNANHVGGALVDDGVDDDGGLPGLAVADEELALTAADGNHRINGLDSGLQRLVHRQPVHHPGRQALDGVEFLGGDGALVVGGLAERVDHAADQRFPDRDRHDALRALDDVAFLDFRVVAEEHRAHLVFLEVQRQARHLVREVEQLAGHHVVEAVDARHPVPHRNHCADFANGDRAVVTFDLFADDPCDLVRLKGRHRLSLRGRLKVEGRKSKVKSQARVPGHQPLAPALSDRQPLANRIQVAAHRTVVNAALDSGPDAPEEGRVRLKLQLHGLAGYLAEPRGERRALLGRQIRRGPDLDFHNPLAMVHGLPESHADSLKLREAIIPRKNPQKVRRGFGGPEVLENPVEQADL